MRPSPLPTLLLLLLPAAVCACGGDDGVAAPGGGELGGTVVRLALQPAELNRWVVPADRDRLPHGAEATATVRVHGLAAGRVVVELRGAIDEEATVAGLPRADGGEPTDHWEASGPLHEPIELQVVCLADGEAVVTVRVSAGDEERGSAEAALRCFTLDPTSHELGLTIEPAQQRVLQASVVSVAATDGAGLPVTGQPIELVVSASTPPQGGYVVDGAPVADGRMKRSTDEAGHVELALSCPAHPALLTVRASFVEPPLSAAGATAAQLRCFEEQCGFGIRLESANSSIPADCAARTRVSGTVHDEYCLPLPGESVSLRTSLGELLSDPEWAPPAPVAWVDDEHRWAQVNADGQGRFSMLLQGGCVSGTARLEATAQVDAIVDGDAQRLELQGSASVEIVAP